MAAARKSVKKNPIVTLRDTVRTQLGIRRERALPPPGPIPAVGTVIAHGKVKIHVNLRIDDELWRWLAEQGWREVDLSRERRRYMNAPKNSLEMMMAYPSWQWDEIHDRIVAAAIYR